MAETGPKRTRFQRERDCALIARWRLQGLSVEETTRELAKITAAEDYVVSESMVQKDLTAHQKRWRESAAADTATQMAELVAMIRWERAELIRAWMQSKEPTREEQARRVENLADFTERNPDGTPKRGPDGEFVRKKVPIMGRTEAQTRTVHRNPNARYMEQVATRLDMLIRILGGYAAPKMARDEEGSAGTLPPVKLDPSPVDYRAVNEVLDRMIAGTDGPSSAIKAASSRPMGPAAAGPG